MNTCKRVRPTKFSLLTFSHLFCVKCHNKGWIIPSNRYAGAEGEVDINRTSSVLHLYYSIDICLQRGDLHRIQKFDQIYTTIINRNDIIRAGETSSGASSGAAVSTSAPPVQVSDSIINWSNSICIILNNLRSQAIDIASFSTTNLSFDRSDSLLVSLPNP
jgi:hypothetical protein